MIRIAVSVETANNNMNSLFDHAPALYGAVTFYGAAVLPKLRELSYEKLTLIGDECTQLSMEYPLHLAQKTKKFYVPSWSDEPQSGLQVVTLMVFSLWVMSKENPELCAPLIAKWPIHEAVMLAGENSHTAVVS